ncbi:hypothetical protein Taro_054972 [Colocasia esculenta]|uniref:Uncharacterized protein n=1 Tax=Colocasia esculenta TaxID=4460 RepID=A0A843XRK0_COLES|nr:hypothetical protein [Colocasia esculenta]
MDMEQKGKTSSFPSALLEFLLLWLVRDWLSLLSLVREAHPPTLFRVPLPLGLFLCLLKSSVVLPLWFEVSMVLVRVALKTVPGLFCRLLCYLSVEVCCCCVGWCVLVGFPERRLGGSGGGSPRTSCRDSLSQKFVAGWSWWRMFTPCIASNLFEFIAFLTGLNSNPSGSSDLWVAARPSGSLAGFREVGGASRPRWPRVHLLASSPPSVGSSSITAASPSSVNGAGRSSITTVSLSGAANSSATIALVPILGVFTSGAGVTASSLVGEASPRRRFVTAAFFNADRRRARGVTALILIAPSLVAALAAAHAAALASAHHAAGHAALLDEGMTALTLIAPSLVAALAVAHAAALVAAHAAALVAAHHAAGHAALLDEGMMILPFFRGNEKSTVALKMVPDMNSEHGKRRKMTRQLERKF